MGKATFLNHEFNGFEQVYLSGGKPFDLSSYFHLTLEAGPHASLKWEKDVELAKLAVSLGKKIFWELDSRVLTYIDDTAQLAAIRFAYEHFTKTIFPSFQKDSIAIVLLRGSLNLSKNQSLSFFEKLEAQENIIEILQEIAASLPEELPPVLILEDDLSLSNAEFLLLSSQEVYPHFHVRISSQREEINHLISPVFFFEEVFSDSSQRCKTGLLLPSIKKREELCWQKVLHMSTQFSCPLLLLTETHLPFQWSGLDQIYCLQESIFEPTIRKLKGFSSAGGEIFFTRYQDGGGNFQLLEISQPSYPFSLQ